MNYAPQNNDDNDISDEEGKVLTQEEENTRSLDLIQNHSLSSFFNLIWNKKSFFIIGALLLMIIIIKSFSSSYSSTFNHNNNGDIKKGEENGEGKKVEENSEMNHGTGRVATHYNDKLLEDTVFKGFFESYNATGWRFGEPVVNGTYILPVYNPSAFDREHGPNYSLRQFCKDNLWKENAYLYCPPASSGLFNLRNQAMTCFRLAMDAGLGIIIPRILVRNRENIGAFDQTPTELSYFYDLTNIETTFHEECPEMDVKNSQFNFNVSFDVDPHAQREVYAHDVGEYRARIDDYLMKNQASYGNITVIRDNNTGSAWNFRDSGIKLHMQMYDIFRFNPSFSALAKPILSLLPEKFFSIHLRTEGDFGNRITYEGLTSWFAYVAPRLFPKMNYLYVAVGDERLDYDFRELMKLYGIETVSKWTLAKNDIELTSSMRKLAFDQQGIVDYEVIMKSEHFFGVSLSTFSFGIAVERGKGDLSKCNCSLYQAPLAYCLKSY